jgi:hypothetical protein
MSSNRINCKNEPDNYFVPQSVPGTPEDYVELRTLNKNEFRDFVTDLWRVERCLKDVRHTSTPRKRARGSVLQYIFPESTLHPPKGVPPIT